MKTYKLYKTMFGQECAMTTNEDGSQTSFLLGTDSNEEQAYLAWVAQGNTPLPADEVTNGN